MEVRFPVKIIVFRVIGGTASARLAFVANQPANRLIPLSAGTASEFRSVPRAAGGWGNGVPCVATRRRTFSAPPAAGPWNEGASGFKFPNPLANRKHFYDFKTFIQPSLRFSRLHCVCMLLDLRSHKSMRFFLFF